MPKIIETRLIEEFKDKRSFTREELFDFFLYFEPDLNSGTFGWRIYDLKNRNILKSLRRGLYVISYKPNYIPALSAEPLKMAKGIVKKFDDIKCCIWETEWLSEFLQHQSSKRIILVEIEKQFVESLYYFLKDNFRNDLYIDPDEKQIDFYISESSNPVIIKNLITRSPVRKTTKGKPGIFVPQLEKILVDLYAQKKLFSIYQGSELLHIYENALKAYSINFTKLFSYAQRREKEKEIKAFMMDNLRYLVEDIMDD